MSEVKHTPRPARPPLRTFTELCEELGEDRRHVQGVLGTHPNAPKPALRCYGQVLRNTWYEPVAFRKWWQLVQQERAAIAKAKGRP